MYTDDLDEPFAAFAAGLAREAEGCGVLLLMGDDPTASGEVDSAINLIKRSAPSIRLHALSATHTRQLIGSVFGQVPHVESLANSLHRASGAPEQRMTEAIALAKERYDNTDDALRVLPPASAISALARAMSLALAFFSISYDRPLLEALPDISALAPISPAAQLITQNHLQPSVTQHTTGQGERLQSSAAFRG